MKLIDVDALNLEYEVEMADDWKTAHEIANHIRYAPEVDAIPVKFIIDYLNKGGKDKISECLKEWEKQNESNIGD